MTPRPQHDNAHDHVLSLFARRVQLPGNVDLEREVWDKKPDLQVDPQLGVTTLSLLHRLQPMLRSSTLLAPRCAARALRAPPFRSGVAFPFRARVRHTVSASQQEQQQREKLKVPSSPPPPGNNNNKDKDQQQDTKLETVVLELKKAGMDTARARKLLAAWTKIGVNDPEQLRKLLIQRSMQPLTNTLLQCLVDGIASFGGAWAK